MDIAITKMSSKGQIVIPSEMRDNMKEGEKLLIIKDKDQFIIQKVSKLSKKILEDIEFARRTEKAMQEIESGKGVTMDFDEFIEEMKKW